MTGVVTILVKIDDARPFFSEVNPLPQPLRHAPLPRLRSHAPLTQRSSEFCIC